MFINGKHDEALSQTMPIFFFFKPMVEECKLSIENNDSDDEKYVLEQTIFQYDGQKRILWTYDEVQAELEDEREQKIARAGVFTSFYDVKFKSTPKPPPLFIIEDFPQTGGNCFALYCSEEFHDEMKRRKIKGIEALPLSEMKNIGFVDTESD